MSAMPRRSGTKFCASSPVGGSGVNYYMWHGGTNFGRNGMYLQTTSYGFDAPLNEWGEPTAKSHLLSDLHRVLRAHEETLLDGKAQHLAAPMKEEGVVSVLWSRGADKCAITLNTGTEPRLIRMEGAKPLLHPVAGACLWEFKKREPRPAWQSWAATAPRKTPPVLDRNVEAGGEAGAVAFVRRRRSPPTARRPSPPPSRSNN